MNLMTRILAVSIVLCAATSPAFATKCYVKEYGMLGGPNTQGSPTQIAAEPELVQQPPVDFTAAHAESAPFGAQTRYVRIWCDVQASYQFGKAPVALNTYAPLGAGSPEYFGVNVGDKVSFVGNP